jgi:predicted extracellular nuclease
MLNRIVAQSTALAAGLALIGGITAQASTHESSAPRDLLISEYVEGSSFNKAVEFYNGTGGPVDLADYALGVYNNGSTSPSVTLPLSGTLADGDVYVLAHSSSASAILAVADETSGAGLWNGDDALVLYRDGDVVVDAFGTVGIDPGTEWPGGGSDDTLRRKADACAGDTDPFDFFEVAPDWDVFPNNSFDGLGEHETSCDPTGPVENVAPAVSATVPAHGAQGVATSAALTVTFTEPVVLDDAFAVLCSASGDVAFTVSGGPSEYVLTPASEFAEGEECELTITGSAVLDTDAEPLPMTDDVTVTFTVAQGVTPISAVQGSGETTPFEGQVVTVEGVVVGDYEGAQPNLRGFYLQSRDQDADDNPLTSEGLFVFNGVSDDVDLGDFVSVTGTAGEFQGQTQMSAVTDITVLDSDHTVAPATVELPLTAADDLEAFEGMLVTFPQTLHVTEFFQLGRFGEIVVSSGDRLTQPTSVAAPGPAANAIQHANDLNRVKVDDALNSQNADPIVFGGGGDPLTASNPLRGGDSVTDLVGVMTYTWAGNASSGNAYRVRPVGDLSDSGLVAGGVVPEFVSENSRPTGPPAVGGSMSVASFNVLNYFVTLDDGPDVCGGNQNLECRGADSALELDRQRAKLVQALLKLDADVIAMMELENTPGAEPLADIVDALNAATAPGTWDYVDTGAIGTDAIKQGIIYQPGSVSLAGDYALLDSSVDSRFDDTRNRPVLAQSFEEVASGEVMTVAVNHLKSKGSCPSTGPDADQGDGAGCWNATRTLAAEAMLDWLQSDPTGSGDPDALITGDLNSYAMEDPIMVLKDAGYVDLAAGGYSYVFDGQWGYLDYALASPSLVDQVSGAGEYHINADEVPVLDYNTDFKTPAQVDYLYAPDEFRTSDHDPVLVGLDLLTAVPTCEVEYTIHGQWPGGFIAQLWIKNTGDEPISGWDLGWQFSGDEEIRNLWSGQHTQTGADVSVQNLHWNGTIKPGKHTTLGFVGSTSDGATVPDSFTINGDLCTVG